MSRANLRGAYRIAQATVERFWKRQSLPEAGEGALVLA